MQVGANCSDHQRKLESAARAAIEQLHEHKLTEAERMAMRTKFVEFAAILRRWEQATTTGPVRGKVEGLCQREP
jgi:hypothetical protein